MIIYGKSIKVNKYTLGKMYTKSRHLNSTMRILVTNL